MEKTKETLWNDYYAVSDLIKCVEADHPNYKLLLDERDKLRNELIKLDEVSKEINLKKSQIEAEDKREKTRNIITIGTFVVTTGVSVWTVVKTFRFDQVATMTSTLGRSSITNVVSKMFKR